MVWCPQSFDQSSICTDKLQQVPDNVQTDLGELWYIIFKKTQTTLSLFETIALFFASIHIFASANLCLNSIGYHKQQITIRANILGHYTEDNVQGN